MHRCVEVRLVGHGSDVDGASNGRRTVDRAAGPPLDLDVLHRSLDVEEVDPEHVELLGIVLRDAVDGHRQTALAEPSHAQRGIADGVPVFRRPRDGRLPGQVHGQILHVGLPLQLLTGNVG